MIQSQKKSYIVASDIASRGIDLEGITHVISCGFPKDLKFYIHRAGRTGRASVMVNVLLYIKKVIRNRFNL